MRRRNPLAPCARRMAMASPVRAPSRNAPPACSIRSSAEMSPPTNIGGLPVLWGEAGAPRHAMSRTSDALLTCRGINGNRRPGGRGDVDGAAKIDDREIAAQEVTVRSSGLSCSHRGVECARPAVDRDEALVATRKSYRVGAVVPPVVDVGPCYHMTEAHHVEDRKVAVLADPLPDRRRLEARRARDVQRPSIRIGRWAHRISRRTFEPVARQDLGVAVGLGGHPDVGDTKDVTSAIADAAVMLRVVILKKYDG